MVALAEHTGVVAVQLRRQSLMPRPYLGSVPRLLCSTEVWSRGPGLTTGGSCRACSGRVPVQPVEGVR